MFSLLKNQVYPPVPPDTPISAVLQFGKPTWHSLSCPSFYSRLQRFSEEKDGPKHLNFCAMGDSNTRRTCNVRRTEGPGSVPVSCMMPGQYTDALDSLKQDLGLPKFLHDSHRCISSKGVVAINVGHHVKDVNAAELSMTLHKLYNDLIYHIIGPGPRKFPVIIWSTLASIASCFNQEKFAPILHFKSNAYREYLANEELKMVSLCPVESFCAHFYLLILCFSSYRCHFCAHNFFTFFYFFYFFNFLLFF